MDPVSISAISIAATTAIVAILKEAKKRVRKSTCCSCFSVEMVEEKNGKKDIDQT